MKICRERPGKKIEDVRGLDLYDNEGHYMGQIALYSGGNLYQVIVTTTQERLAIHVLHPSTGGVYTEISGPPTQKEDPSVYEELVNMGPDLEEEKGK